MKSIAYTVYSDLNVKHGPIKGNILSILLNMTALAAAAGRKPAQVNATGKFLASYCGWSVRACTKAVNEMIEDGTLLEVKTTKKEGKVVIITDPNLSPVMHYVKPEPKKTSEKSEEEKEVLRIAYALYQKRIDFSPSFAGNKLDFVTQFKKLIPFDQGMFATAVDNWIDNATEQKSSGLTGINNFLKSGEWKDWVHKVSDIKLQEMRDKIPCNTEGQYDRRSDEFIEYQKVYDLKYGKRTKEDGSLVIHGASWAELGFPKVNVNRGDTKHKGCSVCESTKNITNRPDVSINGSKGYGHCFSCGTKYVVGQPRGEASREEAKNYEQPKLGNVTALSDAGLQYVRDERRISSMAINRAKLVEENGSIAFPYVQDGQLVNIKYRGIKEKTFRQAKNAKPIMYLYDFCKGKKKIIVCEGEFDALSWLTAILDQGLEDEWAVTSVNAGAPNEADSNVDKKLECLTNCIELFEEAELVYLSVDKDPNGERLQKEIIRRVDEDKIRIVDTGDAKDANQFLIDNNLLELLGLLDEAIVYVPEGIHTADGDRDEILTAFKEGFAKGSTTYFPSIDERWTWRTGDVTLWTGYNNDGKSLIVNQMASLKGKYEGWKTGAWSPENLPIAKFWLNIAHPWIGKPFIDGPNEKMTEEELNKAIDVLSDMFYLIDPDDYKIDTILERMKYLIRVYGIRIVILDPFNQIEHDKKRGETTDEYVSRFMTILKRFAVKYDVALILIAHQNPPEKLTQDGNYPRPDKYKIKNGGTFSDKADHIMAPHRPYYKTDPKHNAVDILALKIKDIGLVGDLGVSELEFDRVKHRYKDKMLGWRSPFDTIKIEEEKEIVPTQATMFESDESGTEEEVPF